MVMTVTPAQNLRYTGEEQALLTAASCTWKGRI